MDKLSLEQVKQTAEEGQKEAARALSSLAKRTVDINTSDARLVDSAEIESTLEDLKANQIVVYTQTIPGDQGISFLSMDRKDALDMVDLFNQRAKGSTTVLKDIDYSTITETLNILANSYINSLAKLTGNTIILSVPKTASKDIVQKATSDLIQNKTNVYGVLFGTDLKIEDEGFSVGLYFFFLTSVPEEEGE